VTVDWVNCGLCVDERGVAESIPGVRRGSPGDLWKFVSTSDNHLVVPTK
jgi:tRNA 2-thiouridine synthesizing protein D